MDYQGNKVRDFLHANGNVVLERVDNNSDLRSFTQKEIEDITDGYCTVLGEGGFGKVYKGKLDYHRPVAVKRYKNGTKKEEFAKEVIVHSQINHKNVVRLLGCCTEENALMIVMEFVCNGNLESILHCNNANGPAAFPLDKRLDIAIESAEVLSCMHSMYSPVLHGDIKPANILLDENLRPKISDFGIARLLAAEENQYTRSVIGCIGYVDPLFCQSGILTPKSDVYSFGVVLLEIITRKKAVDGNIILAQSFTEALRKGKKVRQMFDVEIANDRKNMKLLDDIAKLAAECLKLEEKMRPEMVEVADRLRTVRKAFHQRKGKNSTGTNSELTRSVKADKILPLVVSTISMDELKEITNNFSNRALIGEGSSSKVFFGVLKDGHTSAIKMLDPDEEIILELQVPEVSRFKHTNVTQLLRYRDERGNRVLVYEYTSRGSLHDILHGKKNVIGAKPGPVLSWAQRAKIALSAAIGLEFLHEKARPCIVHTCIKSSNILLFDNDLAKIGGVGIHRQPPEYVDNILLDRMGPPPESGYDAPDYATKR
ncbi:putative wall-associated receptor kinase-like 16 isoform X1 [Lolium perenne]|uniref:putative wall-associated receptor kinase-like 16 isoform X1 n=1 Tax=Lolium perenne TaxID=4522 RepID=UPI003A98F19A